MTRSHPAHPAQPDPDPGVDVVPGDPPVPVNIWRLPAGDHDAPVGARLAARLLAEYTRAKDLVYDHLPSPVLRKAAQAAGRGYRAANRFQQPVDRAALAVAVWPLADRGLDPVIVLGGVRRRLRPGGFLAVIVTNPDPDLGGEAAAPVELGPLVAAATAAGLSYLQHIVTMPTGDHSPAAHDLGTAAAPAAADGAIHVRVHGDILVFHRSPFPAGSGESTDSHREPAGGSPTSRRRVPRSSA
jgi:hypothetical protein